jgi:hypothetical protein
MTISEPKKTHCREKRGVPLARRGTKLRLAAKRRFRKGWEWVAGIQQTLNFTRLRTVSVFRQMLSQRLETILLLHE